jgi:PAS domain S-box-containing protein
MNNKCIKILFVEDMPSDAEIARRVIKKESIKFIDMVVDTETDFHAALNDFQPDIIISDYSMPLFDGMSALKITRSFSESLPFIMLTGSINEETAVACMKAGANDYVIKEHMHRLPMAIIEAIRNSQTRIEKERITEALRKSEERLRVAISKSPIVVWSQDRDLRYTWIYNPNPGFKAEEVISKRDEEMLSADDAKSIREIKMKVLTSGKGSKEEVRTTIKGKPFYFQLVTEPLKDEEGKIIGITCASIDITELRNYQLRLQKTINGAIDTIARISEIRDPYTAGHQNRVSQLSQLIAWELGLTIGKIESISIASLIHDIGKIGIPSEILTKPGKLNDIEYSLIKNHPQIGYDILKGVDFNYPIAKIVLQHHERLDGSGYPNKLKGEDILLEARIIAVADVVEAMSSYRPYRPALGIEVALDEIFRNKSILYDADAVDSCIRLFKEKGFQFK